MSTADDLRAGYVYEMAVRQFEVSDTRVFDRPQSGRAFFEGLIRDHLDVGRPEQVVLVFDRKLMPKTPGVFSTKVVTKGVDPQVSCKYKSSRIAPALCFGDPRVMAMLGALVAFTHLLVGFRNSEFTALVGGLLGTSYSRRQATYDLRRLRRKGLIERLPKTHRYLPTPFGRAVAVPFLKAYGRMLGPPFALFDAALPDEISARSPLAVARRRLDHAIDDIMDCQQIAA